MNVIISGAMSKKIENTLLDVIEFGDEPEDIFYCLVDANISPDGLDINKLKLSDPRNFDSAMKESGCLMMLTGDEMEELIRRGEVKRDKLHQTFLELAKKEGILK